MSEYLAGVLSPAEIYVTRDGYEIYKQFKVIEPGTLVHLVKLEGDPPIPEIIDEWIEE